MPGWLAILEVTSRKSNFKHNLIYICLFTVYSVIQFSIIISQLVHYDKDALLCHQLIMMTGNFICENTISKFLSFSTFHWGHRYTSVETMRVF